ncbi:MAG: MGMT family protein, partial [Candidatus Omnitrophica bacterium]|nr:MGMT family protein [Candidatus Omnitrophota bacterium]
TRSYRWVAQQLGDAGLARAVGNALNRTPYAPPPLRLRSGRRPERSRGTPVPCHRVIKSDGSLGGFARGPRSKLLLLKREGWVPRNPA